MLVKKWNAQCALFTKKNQTDPQSELFEFRVETIFWIFFGLDNIYSVRIVILHSITERYSLQKDICYKKYISIVLVL